MFDTRDRDRGTSIQRLPLPREMSSVSPLTVHHVHVHVHVQNPGGVVIGEHNVEVLKALNLLHPGGGGGNGDV